MTFLDVKTAKDHNSVGSISEITKKIKSKADCCSQHCY